MTTEPTSGSIARLVKRLVCAPVSVSHVYTPSAPSGAADTLLPIGCCCCSVASRKAPISTATTQIPSSTMLERQRPMLTPRPLAARRSGPAAAYRLLLLLSGQPQGADQYGNDADSEQHH